MSTKNALLLPVGLFEITIGGVDGHLEEVVIFPGDFPMGRSRSVGSGSLTFPLP